MNTCNKSGQSGFSMIELMIGIVIMGILVALAFPSFQAMLQNTQVRNAAEAITNGLQRARAEAVARNTNVSFSLGIDSTWIIRAVESTEMIEKRESREGSKDVAVIVEPAGATMVTFNSVGSRTANKDGTDPITQFNLSTPESTQNLRVAIGLGGKARMCDPSLVIGSSPRACFAGE